MSIFQDVRNTVTAKDAALHYGLKINRNDMALCPFHNDKNPSLKIDARFHCFACQAHGDAIDFVSRYFGLLPLDAAKKLADDFGIPYDQKTIHKRPPPKPKIAPDDHMQQIQKDYRTLCSWLHILSDWKEAYTPSYLDPDPDDRYATSLLYLPRLEYALDDIFLSGSQADIQAYCSKHRIELDVMELALAKLQMTPEKHSEKRRTA